MIILPSLLGSFFLGFSSLSPRGPSTALFGYFTQDGQLSGTAGSGRDPRLIAALGVKSNLLQRARGSGSSRVPGTAWSVSSTRRR